jgi:hypothetical protein
MAQSGKPEPAADALPPDPYPDYPWIYGWVFQSWLIMFLAVICCALVFYVGSYRPKSARAGAPPRGVTPASSGRPPD